MAVGTHPRRSLSPPQHLSSSARAWRSPVGVLPLHHHHVVVLLLDPLFLNLSLLLAGSRRGRRLRSVRVLNAEVPSVQR